jgi:hypothetical protein
VVVFVFVAINGFVPRVASHGLKNHIEIAFHAKPSPQRSHVDLMGTEVMKHRRAAIEQRLDVDERPRPVSLAEDALTEGKTTGSRFRGVARAHQIVRAGQANDVLRVDGTTCDAILAVRRRRSTIQYAQDFAKLEPAVRLDDDEPAPFDPRIAHARGGEPADITHDAVTDQKARVARHLASLPWLVADLGSRTPPVAAEPFIL